MTGEDPIDAEFEPAPDYARRPPVETPKPGWIGVGAASAAAALVGGLIGVFAGGPGGSNGGDIDALRADIDALVVSQREAETNIAGLEDTVESTAERFQREVQGLVAGDGDTAGLQAVVDDLAALSARLDEGGGEAVAALSERIALLERADGNEAVSPRQMNRAVTVMRERVDALEQANEEIRRGLDVRAEALAGLTTRIARLEEEGGAAPETVDAIEAEIESLRGEIAALRARAVDDADTQAELAARAADSEAAVADAGRRAEAALALAAIESRARRGLAFTSQAAKLEAAMPEDANAAALVAIAPEGAPTLAELRTMFAGARDAALETANEDSGDGWGWVRKAFGGAVTVRRSDEEAEALETAIDAAAARLDENDVAGAIERIDGLDEGSRAAFSDWLAGARKRRDLEAALEALNLALLRTEP